MPQRTRYTATAEQLRLAYTMPKDEALRVAQSLMQTHVPVTAFYRNERLVDRLPEEDRVLDVRRIASRLGVEIVESSCADEVNKVGPYCIETSEGMVAVRGVAVWAER